MTKVGHTTLACFLGDEETGVFCVEIDVEAKRTGIRRTQGSLSGTALLLVFANTLGMGSFLVDSAAFTFNLYSKCKRAFVAGVLPNTDIKASILESRIEHFT